MKQEALQRQGIANQRKAIIEGLGTSIEGFQKVLGEATAKDVMQLVLVTQYFDTLKSIGESDKTNTLFSVAFAGGGAVDFGAVVAVDERDGEYQAVR